MIKVEVIKDFTLGAFDELKNIQRKSIEEKGRLFKGDIFECTKEMADYLLGENALKSPFVKVIEIIPEEVKIEESKTEEIKATKVKDKKTTTKRKSIAKKTKI